MIKRNTTQRGETIMTNLERELENVQRREFNDDHLTNEERSSLLERVRREMPELLDLSESDEEQFLSLLD